MGKGQKKAFDYEGVWRGKKLPVCISRCLRVSTTQLNSRLLLPTILLQQKTPLAMLSFVSSDWSSYSDNDSDDPDDPDYLDDSDDPDDPYDPDDSDDTGDSEDPLMA